MPRDRNEAFRGSPEEVLEAWNVTAREGLGENEADERRERYGANRLEAARRKSVWRIILNQFESVVVLLLLAASATALLFGRTVEAIAIAAALVINAAIGFGTEYAATRSMDALRRMGKTVARARRGGEIREIAADRLVPGDIVELEEGAVVPADLRLIETENLQCNEAALTGESEPVSKSSDALEDDEVPLAERTNMAFKGTAVTRGAGVGVVVGTGQSTEIGRISELVEGAEKDEAPLERRLERLGHRLIVLVVAVGIIVAVSGIFAGKDLALMIETAIVLAIAAVPEGLPVVATLSLGRGMWRMARRNALVKRLSAVETLGATTVILTDKTGTLTENRMVLRAIGLADDTIFAADEDGPFRDRHNDRIDLDERPDLMAALRVGVLCTNARRDENGSGAQGDPMEIALLEGGALAGLERATLLDDLPEEREESFDPDTKMMATFHKTGNGFLVAVKGAPEAVIEASSRVRHGERTEDLDEDGREAWRKRNIDMAGDGLRLLAIAEKTTTDETADPYEDLVLLGLVGLYDPPRGAVADAIRDCREAGIRLVMVTGDQPATARNVMRELGMGSDEEARVLKGDELKDTQPETILRSEIFARVSPEHKLDLVEAFQDAGEIVGMTGDGVNDAPALKKSDIGIAMGGRGTDVAREAADIVLKDDAFETIVMAVRQGRTIFSNIRKFVIFLLSGNLGQIMAVSLAALVGAPLPLLPLQILFLNLLLDVFPALALGVGGDEASVMRQPPRDPKEPILTRDHWLAITGFGVTIGASVLVCFAIALVILELDTAEAVTVSFLVYALARLWHIFNMRSLDSHWLRNNVVGNPFIYGAIAVCVGLLAAALFIPPFASLLDLVAPADALAWLLILAGSLAPLVVGQLGIALAHARRDKGADAAAAQA